jgi:hypothetical protein
LLFRPNSVAWQNAVGELCRVTRECLEFARVQSDRNMLDVAESAAARVRTQCPIEAGAAGV